MKTNNTILVTGSSGLLGAPLVKSLLKSGYNVIGMDPIETNEKHENFRHFWDENLNVVTINLCLEKYRVSKVLHAV